MNSPFVVPVVMFVMIGLSIILRGPLGQAIAERVRGGTAGEHDGHLREELDGLRLEMEDLRSQLAEAQERIDFTERLLARRDEPAPLPAPRD